MNQMSGGINLIENKLRNSDVVSNVNLNYFYCKFYNHNEANRINIFFLPCVWLYVYQNWFS